MKKTTFRALLFLGLFAMTLSSCGNTNPYADDPRYPIYQLALEDGFTGTYQEWLDSIKGEDGENGQTPHIGENGNWWIGDTDTGVPATGPQGPAGSDGQDGADGQDGSQGPQGEPGSQGPQGEPGEDGEDGIDGKDGTSMLTGEGAPNDNLGKDGDSYIDTNTWDFYVKVNGTWVLKGNIKADGADHDGTEGLEFYPINDTECAVGIGTARLLKDIVVPGIYKDYTVTTIIEKGFEGSKVENIYLPSTIKNVGANVFNNTPLTNLYFNGSIEQYCEVEYQSQSNSQFTSLEPLHYYYMDNGNYVEMVDVVIPEGVETINDYAFFAMYHLNSISVPSTVKSIGDFAFTYSLNLKTLNLADNSILDSIGSYAFSNCSSLTSIEIPNSVTSIGHSTFYNCTSLTSVVIPDNVTSIGYCTFYNCRSLTSIVIPDSVISIDSSAFEYCSSLTSIVIPDSITSIGGCALSSCSSLTSIVIPDSVTSIGYCAFSDCSSLIIYCEATSKPSGWDSYWNPNGRPVYWDIEKEDICCDEENSLIYIIKDEKIIITRYFGESSSINIPSEINGYSVNTVGSYAFYNCTSLTSITIPDSVTSIGRSAFSSCSSLTSITIPDSVTTIGDYAFEYCSSLIIYCEAASRPSGWDSYWNPDGRPVYWDIEKEDICCDEENSLIYIIKDEKIIITRYFGESSSINIPSKINEYFVTAIGSSAFSSCSSLTSIVIPDSVTSIGNMAFSGCSSLTSIVIPDSVTTIGYRAFENCSSLTIYCEAASQPSGWNSRWNYNNRPVYWAGGWEYDENGNPTVITPELVNGAPVEGEQYYFGVDKGDGNVYYADGGMYKYYGSSSSKISEAVSASVEEVDGGYYLIINDMYVNVTINGKYNNFTYSDSASTLWKYNEQYNTLVTEINGENYFIGNFGTYTYLAIVNVSYLSNNGCPARFYK